MREIRSLVEEQKELECTEALLKEKEYTKRRG